MTVQRPGRPVLTIVANTLRKPKRAPASAHVAALTCFGAALLSMAARRQISRELLELIFDRAEEISLDGESATLATGIVRDLWDDVVRGALE